MKCFERNRNQLYLANLNATALQRVHNTHVCIDTLKLKDWICTPWIPYATEINCTLRTVRKLPFGDEIVLQFNSQRTVHVLLLPSLLPREDKPSPFAERHHILQDLLARIQSSIRSLHVSKIRGCRVNCTWLRTPFNATLFQTKTLTRRLGSQDRMAALRVPERQYTRTVYGLVSQ